jgi:hypothetical protein
LWHFVIPWEPYFLTLLWIDVVLCAYVFLITWRIARRFGGRGLAVLLFVGAVFGPFRDSWYMAKFPEWGSYARGSRLCWQSPERTSCWDSGPRDDATDRRSRLGGPAGAPTVGTAPILRRLKWRRTTFCRFVR